jgi:hypothetical protein
MPDRYAALDETAEILRSGEAWAAAIEALAEAEQQGRDGAAEREAVRAARIALYDAVLARRAKDRKAAFTGAGGRAGKRRFAVLGLLDRI